MKEKIQEIIARRIATDPEYDFGIKSCWNEALSLLKSNPEEMLKFVESEASEEEVYWLSEILCDIYDATQDERFVNAFEVRALSIANAEMKRSILQEIEFV